MRTAKHAKYAKGEGRENCFAGLFECFAYFAVAPRAEEGEPDEDRETREICERGKGGKTASIDCLRISGISLLNSARI